MGFFDTLKVNTTASKAHNLHKAGMALRNQGKYAESEAKLDEAVAMYAEAYKGGFRQSKTLQHYALLLMRRGRFEEAREIMLTCGKDKTMPADDRFMLRVDYSICQWKLGNLDKALETIETAGGYKKNGMYYTTKGIYVVEKCKITHEYDDAIAFMDEAVDYDDEDEGTLDNAAQLHMNIAEDAKAAGDTAKYEEEHAKALDFFKRAYEKKPVQISSSYYYAKLLYEDGKKEEARKVADSIANIPFSHLLQVTREEYEALLKEIRK